MVEFIAYSGENLRLTRPGPRKMPNTPVVIKDCNNEMTPKGILLTYKSVYCSAAFRVDYF